MIWPGCGGPPRPPGGPPGGPPGPPRPPGGPPGPPGGPPGNPGGWGIMRPRPRAIWFSSSEPYLVLIALGEKPLHAGQQLVLAELAVLIGVEFLAQRPCQKIPRPESAGPAARPLLFQEIAGRPAFFLVQPAVAVLVELLDQLALLAAE